MPRDETTLQRVLSGDRDAAIDFQTLRNLLTSLGFTERVRGSHFIYSKDGLPEIINLQPAGRHAKPYQVRQVRSLILKYHLG